MNEQLPANRSLNRSTEGRAKRWSLPRYLPLVPVALVGVAFSVIIYLAFQSSEQDRVRADVERRAQSYTTAIQAGVDRSVEVVDALGGVFEGSPDQTRAQFRASTKTLLAHHGDIQALEWIPKITNSERASYEQAAQDDGLTGFRITERNSDGSLQTASQRNEYFPVFYVEPMAGNEAAIGYDLASNDQRREALSTACDNAIMVATSPITLVQEKGSQKGFLLDRKSVV